ncbi:MAG: hypothetical protein HY741_10305 [Chloroflexi bacterium]|nr:hypothetical protein [Chloroflexota bacterium]
MDRFLLISIGAIAGANLRYGVGDWVAQRLGASFPFGALVVNLTGTRILGIFITLATERFLLDPRWMHNPLLGNGANVFAQKYIAHAGQPDWISNFFLMTLHDTGVIGVDLSHISFTQSFFSQS